MSLTPAQKLTKAKVKLLLDFPFFSTLALSMKYIEDPTVGTACTNGKEIRWDPSYVTPLDINHCVGLLAHECLHPAFFHHTRRQGRDPYIWNVACDYAIDQILVDQGLKVPDALIDPAYKGKSAEEIYRLLPKQGLRLSGGGLVADPSGSGTNGTATGSEIIQFESEMKQLVAKAMIVAKQAGKLPAGLERLIEEALQPKINWREVLNRFLTQVVQSDYSWRKPNKRYIGSDLYLPAMESIESGDFVLAVDTSVSIGMRELSQFAAEMREIAEAFKCGFKIIWCDAAVAGVQDIEPDEDMELKPAGFGGTDFRPPFDYIEANDINLSAFVYFTDGFCASFPEEPAYPVLWAVMDNKSFTPPFGETVHMQSGEDF